MKIIAGIVLSIIAIIFLGYIYSLIRYRLAMVRSHKKLDKLFNTLPEGLFAPPNAVQVSYIFEAIRLAWKDKKDGDYLCRELLGFKGFEAEFLKVQGAELIAMKGEIQGES